MREGTEKEGKSLGKGEDKERWELSVGKGGHRGGGELRVWGIEGTEEEGKSLRKGEYRDGREEFGVLQQLVETERLETGRDGVIQDCRRLFFISMKIIQSRDSPESVGCTGKRGG